jgi:flagella basal body P-ring formation protein FlgA
MTGLTPLLLTGRAGDAPVSRGLAARVAARIASAWRVPVGQVRLTWGHCSGIASPDDETTFRVLGRGEDGWFVVVFDPAASTAMAVRVRAGIECPVMVASRSLAAGSRIGEGDLREEMRVRWGVPAADSAVAPASGWEVRRPLTAGEVVTAPAVTPPPLVLAGQPVKMEWQRGGVEVSVMGIALNSARRGEKVRARLEERPAQLTGTVVAPGTAVLMAGEARR